ncbi:MAG: fructose-6-phosphate aldolase [Thermoplasmata archaeon]|nr:MAG: fructose-6-phosphate aldolase [Thermoplasmata archaeon]HDJ26994.1 fructose-6-phosphate aldolase [Aciduliprofundum sp.]
MRIFLDTANLEQIRRAKEWGVLDGVTTNPTIISRESMPYDELVREILRIVPGPVSLEVLSEDAEGMVREARELASLGENVVVKIPMTAEGMKAVRVLSEEGIRTNVTLVFSPLQALIAAKAGATYISPFVGRLDDIGHDGMAVVRDILQIIDNYGFESEVIVASVRHPRHVYEAALLGAPIVTMPFHVLEKMFKHPKTDEGLIRFKRDWEQYLRTVGRDGR